jgi:hypothetical protein
MDRASGKYSRRRALGSRRGHLLFRARNLGSPNFKRPARGLFYSADNLKLSTLNRFLWRPTDPYGDASVLLDMLHERVLRVLPPIIYFVDQQVETVELGILGDDGPNLLLVKVVHILETGKERSKQHLSRFATRRELRQTLQHRSVAAVHFIRPCSTQR